MKVTIIGKSAIANDVRYENVDWDLVSIKKINKRNGMVREDVRIANGKRDIVISNGAFNEITIQDEETGRYIYKYNR